MFSRWKMGDFENVPWCVLCFFSIPENRIVISSILPSFSLCLFLYIFIL